MYDVEHTPLRPSWECRACGQTWPCGPARESLTAEAAADGLGGRSSLAMLMWGYLEDYALDVGPGPLGEAFDRFIAWTRPSRSPFLS